MRGLSAAFIALFLSTVAMAQTTTATPTLPTTVYEQSISLMDASGNLVVIDSGAYLQSTTITLRNGSTRAGISRTPKTRIIVVRPSKTEVMEYDGRIEVFALGQKALYAVIDSVVDGTTDSSPTVTRSLVALTTSSTMPAAVGGFPSLTVNAYAALRNAGQDSFTLVDPPQSSSSTSTRTGQVIAFNGSAFAVTTSASLP
jgi:hypothetical protein